MISESARGRLDEFIVTATEIFMAKGYRRAKMADVTGAMGLSEGAIYRYFEGKEALFDLVLHAAANPGIPVQVNELHAATSPAGAVQVNELPIPNPAPGQTLECLRAAIEERTSFESLARAFRTPVAREAVADELEAIVREIYDATFRFRTGVRLVERCAMDWPELAALWFGGHRRQLEDQLARYLQDRAERGWLRPGLGPQVTARVILELVAYFAMNRYRHPAPLPIDDQLAEDAVADNIVNAYVVKQTG